MVLTVGLSSCDDTLTGGVTGVDIADSRLIMRYQSFVSLDEEHRIVIRFPVFWKIIKNRCNT